MEKNEYDWLIKAVKKYGIHCVRTRISSSGMNAKFTVLTVVKYNKGQKPKIADVTYTVKKILDDKTRGDLHVGGCGFNRAQHIADQLRWALKLKAPIEYSS